MNETLSLLSALLAGALIALMFFGGLWWTVRKTVSSKHPALWVFASLLVRTTIALAGFYFVSGGHWQRLLVCLLGFMITRSMVTKLSGRPTEGRNASAKETGHAA